MKIAKESLLIAIIGLADLITTVMWIHFHGAEEANPVFAQLLKLGVVWFALMKLLLLVGPIYLLEWARHRRPRFTLYASRFAISAYCGLYAIGVLHLNPELLQPRSAQASVYPTTFARARTKHSHTINRSGAAQVRVDLLREAARRAQTVASTL